MHIGTTGTETTFLPENELPSHCRLTNAGDDDEASAAAMKKTVDELEANEIRKAIEKSRTEQGAAASSSSGIRAGTSTGPSSTIVSSPASAAATAVSSGDNFSETDIQDIQKLGFPRDKCIAELRSANGNKTQAIAALFAKSLKF